MGQGFSEWDPFRLFLDDAICIPANLTLFHWSMGGDAATHQEIQK